MSGFDESSGNSGGDDVPNEIVQPESEWLDMPVSLAIVDARQRGVNLGALVDAVLFPRG